MKRTGEFTRNKIAAFPYILAAKEDQNIFSRDSAPEGFTLSDPDHLPGYKIDALYHHWLNRQQKRLSPFIMLNASPQHQSSVRTSAKAKGKRKAEYVPVTSSEDDEGDGDNEDEDADQEEEATTLPIKRGPPNRKTQRVAEEQPIAGSSKLPPPPPKKPLKMNQKSANKDAPSSLPMLNVETDGRRVCFPSYKTFSDSNTLLIFSRMSRGKARGSSKPRICKMRRRPYKSPRRETPPRPQRPKKESGRKIWRRLLLRRF